MAEELWSILEHKLRQPIAAGDITNVPLGRVLARVAELASLPRHGWALQTREPRPDGFRRLATALQVWGAILKYPEHERYRYVISCARRLDIAHRQIPRVVLLPRQGSTVILACE